MKQKHFIISLTEDLTVSKTSGKLTRNSNGTQWIDVELDGWVLPEGSALYVEFSHLDGDSGLTQIVGPLNLIFNTETDRYVVIAPPELISVAGKWSYSIELRYDIAEHVREETSVSEISVADEDNILYKTTVVKGLDKETGLPTEITVKTDKDGDVISTSTIVGAGGEKVLSYNSLTSAIYQFEIIDTVISRGTENSFTREAELLAAAKTLTDAILAGHSAEAALTAAQNALQSEQNAAQAESNAAQSEGNASISAQMAASSEANAQASANLAERSMEEAARQAEDSAESARQAEAAQNAATEQATAAAGSAAQASTSEQNAVNSAAGAESAKLAAEQASMDAQSWADIAKQWAEYGIKINTDYTSLDELPEEGDSRFIYFIPNGGDGNNSYDEYVWVSDKSSYEKIGTTEIDLTPYAKLEGAVFTGAVTATSVKGTDGVFDGNERVYSKNNPPPNSGFHIVVGTQLTNYDENTTSFNKIVLPYAVVGDYVIATNPKTDCQYVYKVTAVTTLSTTVSYQNVTLNITDDLRVVDNKIQIGPNANAAGNYSIAEGVNASATNSSSVAIGANTSSSQMNATAIGADSKATTAHGVALGSNATAKGTKTIAIGHNANSDATRSIAMGMQSGSGQNTFAQNNTYDSVAIGSGAQVDNCGPGIAIGCDVKANGSASGKQSQCAIAMGWGARAAGSNTIAMGHDAVADTDGSMVFGNASLYKRADFKVSEGLYENGKRVYSPDNPPPSIIKYSFVSTGNLTGGSGSVTPLQISTITAYTGLEDAAPGYLLFVRGSLVGIITEYLNDTAVKVLWLIKDTIPANAPFMIVEIYTR